MEFTQTFNSFLAYAEHVSSAPRAPGAKDSSSAHRATMSWDLELGLEGAIAYGTSQDTWREGIDQLVAGVERAQTMRREAYVPQVRSNVVGFRPNVPAIVAGVPLNMYRMEHVPGESQVVTIAISGFSSGCTAPAMLNRGIGVLALCDALEASGHRVEIWEHEYLEVSGKPMACGKRAHLKVLLKAAGDRYDPNTIAFAIAHPGNFRRLFFLWEETTPEVVRATQDSYGHGLDLDSQGYNFPLGYQTSDGPYETLEGTLGHLEGLARDQGFEVNLLGAL